MSERNEKVELVDEARMTRVSLLRGSGEEGDPVRRVEQFWRDGVLVADLDSYRRVKEARAKEDNYPESVSKQSLFSLIGRYLKYHESTAVCDSGARSQECLCLICRDARFVIAKADGQ